MKKVLLGVIAIFIAAPVTGASAEPMINLDVQTKNVKSNGLFNMVFSIRAFDTTGVKGPEMKNMKLFFPRAGQIRPRGFPTCNVKKLTEARDAKVCKKAVFGTGIAKADVRPLFTELIAAKMTLFLGKPRKVPNASTDSSKPLMNLVLLAEPISSDPLISSAKLVMEAPMFIDRSDPRFGYRMDFDMSIDTGIPGLTISVADIKSTTKQRYRTVRTCKKKRRGKCVKKSRKKIPLFRLHKCPKSKKMFFKGEFILLDDTVLTREVELPCRFKIRNK